jgi:hypothetical protein
MNFHHVEKIDGSLQNIVKACYPDYKGKKIRISNYAGKMNLSSYWDGGSRTYYVFYHLDSGKTAVVHSNHPFFEANQPSVLDKLPERVLLVAHIFFCGKDLGIEIHANTSDMAPLLPTDKPVLTENEKIVLNFTAHYKNSYGGETNIRFKYAHRTHKISRDDWLYASACLKQERLLTETGAITNRGRNALSDNPISVR